MTNKETRRLAELILTNYGEQYDGYHIEDALEEHLGRLATDTEYDMVADALGSAEVTITFKGCEW